MILVSADELVKEGYLPYNDGDLSAIVRRLFGKAYVVLMDKNKRLHLFSQHPHYRYSHIVAMDSYVAS